MENVQRNSSYKSSADELGRRLMELYKKKIFPRMGKDYAESLYRSGLEAGACVYSLGDVNDAESKVKIACDAVVKLRQTVYSAEQMVAGGFYTAAQIAPLSAYIEKLVEALSNLIKSLRERLDRAKPAVQQPMQRQVVVQQRPVYVHPQYVQPQYVPAPQPAPQPMAQPAPQPAPYRDPDGFDDPA